MKQHITVHTEGSTVVINDIIRIKCRDEENATLFAGSFECDVYHHTTTIVDHVENTQLITALKKCIEYISNDIEENIIDLSSEPDMRKWLSELKTLVGEPT